MALSLLAVLALLRWFDGEGAILDLAPYLDGPAATGAGASAEELLLRHAWWARPFLFALAGVMAFLGFEVLIRRVFRQAHESAALLSAVAFFALPGHSALFVTRGGTGLLMALLAVSASMLLLLSRPPAARLAGALLPWLAVALHPAMAVLAPGLSVCACAGRAGESAPSRVLFALAPLLAAGAGLATGAGLAFAEPLHPSLEAERMRHSMDVLLASPAYALQATPRSLLPTGFEVLAGELPKGTGAAIALLLAGLGAMTAGMGRAGAALALAAIAGAAPWFTPLWVPGDRAVALLPLLPLAGLLALFLGVCRGGAARDLFVGLALGIAVVAGYQGFRRAGFTGDGNYLANRAVAFQIPRQRISDDADVPAPWLERDPARLVLVALDIAARAGRSDPAVFHYADAMPISKFPPHVIDPAKLERIRREVAQDPGPMPVDASEGERRLFEELLPPLEALLAELSAAAIDGDPDAWYERVLTQFTTAIPEMMEVVSIGSRHPRVIHWSRSVAMLASNLGDKASRLGDTRYSIPIHELAFALTGNPRAAAILAVELTHVGRYDEAAAHIEELKAAIPPADVLGAVMRGSLGRIHFARGRDLEALHALDAAWSGLCGRGGRGADVLSQVADRRSLDYWLVVEMLSLRYELAKKHDRALVPQAEYDLEEALNYGMSVGKRMIPALAFKGRLEHLRGDRSAARACLESLLSLPRGGVMDRADRVDHARFRLVGLRTLLEVLDPDEAELRKAAEEQIALF